MSENARRAAPRAPEPPRYRLRVCFSKTGRLRFISHLDFIRAFERAARRSRLPLAYTEGYSPAPKIAYGWPLPIGVAGLAEYLDIELTDRVPPEDAVRRLEEVLPEELEIREARYLSPHGPSLMAEMDTGVYLIRMPAAGLGVEQWREASARLLGRERLESTRGRGTGPGGEPKKKTVDIRPLLRKVEVRGVADGEVTVLAELELSDRGTARPDEVAGFLWEEVASGGAGSGGSAADAYGVPGNGDAAGSGDAAAGSGAAAGGSAAAAGSNAATARSNAAVVGSNAAAVGNRPARPEGMVAVRIGLRREGRPAGPR